MPKSPKRPLPPTSTTPAAAGADAKQLSEEEQARELLAGADNVLAAVESSDFYQRHANSQGKRQYPQFAPSEIEKGPVLGVGGFGIVLEVSRIRLAGDEDDDAGVAQDNAGHDAHYHIRTARSHMAAHVVRRRHTSTAKNDTDDDKAKTSQNDSIDEARYALKELHADLSAVERARGRIDLALEAKFLSLLWHPNLCKMRGYATGPFLQDGFFLVLDRLYQTLDEQIDFWKTELFQTKSSSSSKSLRVWSKVLLGRQSKEEKAVTQRVLVHRLLVAYDLASAFAYLHENRVVYRDIKQENIGFDIRGDVKVFDFGLCKGLSKSLKAKDPKSGLPVYGYKLTGRTGSIPYMAPEVVECHPYDTKCDVFSFAILLWEVMSLKPAFKGYTKMEYLQRVCRQKERPSLPKAWPAMVRLVLQEGWHTSPEKRPTMKRAAHLIRGDLNDLTSDSSVRNRTTHMLDRSRNSMSHKRQIRQQQRERDESESEI